MPTVCVSRSIGKLLNIKDIDGGEIFADCDLPPRHPNTLPRASTVYFAPSGASANSVAWSSGLCTLASKLLNGNVVSLDAVIVLDWFNQVAALTRYTIAVS